jgi:hypothetical protein
MGRQQDYDGLMKLKRVFKKIDPLRKRRDAVRGRRPHGGAVAGGRLLRIRGRGGRSSASWREPVDCLVFTPADILERSQVAGSLWGWSPSIGTLDLLAGSRSGCARCISQMVCHAYGRDGLQPGHPRGVPAAAQQVSSSRVATWTCAAMTARGAATDGLSGAGSLVGNVGHLPERARRSWPLGRTGDEATD